MKRYMVVYSVDGEQGAVFRDTLGEADSARMDIAVSLGGMAQVYEWIDNYETVDGEDLYLGSAYEFMYE